MQRADLNSSAGARAGFFTPLRSALRAEGSPC
ncbi:hypothetical protein SAMN00790413_01064 [Deinococcus hopiensis KR-140]|uniref:Uncharacterized protein n=1 Tax=Deinococcus hopiensis KR-140 TaxID=695939 RepID=A0A1W1VD56_9DEIO|nr:hypothetical protein SAMN00790413_01064 [Deinococcus hopiensis KR-140]